METSKVSLNKPIIKKTIETKENLSTSNSKVRQNKLLYIIECVIILSM